MKRYFHNLSTIAFAFLAIQLIACGQDLQPDAAVRLANDNIAMLSLSYYENMGHWPASLSTLISYTQAPPHIAIADWSCYANPAFHQLDNGDLKMVYRFTPAAATGAKYRKSIIVLSPPEIVHRPDKQKRIVENADPLRDLLNRRDADRFRDLLNSRDYDSAEDYVMGMTNEATRKLYLGFIETAKSQMRIHPPSAKMTRISRGSDEQIKEPMNDSQQSGPAYPPQGVGSADP